jgi:hypothetical protein
MNGGWQTLTDASGQPFANEGLCIASAIHHPVSLADLAGSVGVPLGTFGFSASGCSSVQVPLDFYATYPGSSAVGNVTIQINGCLTELGLPNPSTFVGTFTITTNVGTVNGTVAGEFGAVATSPPQAPYVAATLTLTVSSGSGRFTGTTGTLNVSLQMFAVTPDWAGTITPA